MDKGNKIENEQINVNGNQVQKFQEQNDKVTLEDVLSFIKPFKNRFSTDPIRRKKNW